MFIAAPMNPETLLTIMLLRMLNKYQFARLPGSSYVLPLPNDMGLPSSPQGSWIRFAFTVTLPAPKVNQTELRGQLAHNEDRWPSPNLREDELFL
jgi:hypothetical protein